MKTDIILHIERFLKENIEYIDYKNIKFNYDLYEEEQLNRTLYHYKIIQNTKDYHYDNIDKISIFLQNSSFVLLNIQKDNNCISFVNLVNKKNNPMKRFSL